MAAVLLVLVLAAGCTGGGETSEAAPDGTAAETAEQQATTTDADIVAGPEGDADTAVHDGGAGGDDLVWTVLAVDLDDRLNVRAAPDPDSEVVDTLDPWATDVVVRADTKVSADGARWRLVETTAGISGWVNGRFLVAQPAELTAAEAEALVAETDALVEWVRTGATGERQLADRALWVGGIGIYADLPTAWTWIPGSELTTSDGWRVVRDFSFEGLSPCPECRVSLLDFLRLARIDSTTRTLVDDIPPASSAGLLDGLLWQAPETLHRVVLDTPSTTFLDDEGNPQPTLDWQRIHVVFDWSDGEPRVVLVHTHGWTP